MICLLGPFRILSLRPLASLPADGKTSGLLRVLALEPNHTVPRAVLLENLWPNVPPELARQSLNSLVYHLRRVMAGALNGQAPVLNGDGFYRLNTSAGVGVDIVQFEALIDGGHRALAYGDVPLAMTKFEWAVGWYRGDLNPGDEIDLVIERERLHARYLSALSRLAGYYLQIGDLRRSLEHARRLVASDPCREDGHRIIMRSYALRGERAQALHQYRFCEAVLRSQFDADPEPATVELFEQLRRSSFTA